MEKESVLSFLKKRTSKPVSFREISRALDIRKKEARMLKRVLRSLVNSGAVFKTRSNLYGIAEQMSLVPGFFEAHRDGYGFVVPEKAGEKDLFIPPRKTSGAMSGDRVIVRVESPAKREGRIIKILERRRKKVVGKLCYGKNFYYVKPRSRKIPFDVYISPEKISKAKVGDIVVVELTAYPTVSRPPEGRVLKVIPATDGPRSEIEMVIEDHGLPHKFPSAVLKEAREFTPLDSKHLKGSTGGISAQGRVDCRDLLTVTIDGESAKDFDDAVSIRRMAGGFILWVHIADVSHYVPWDSRLDLESRQRGTSVYFPGRVIPMLPKVLSNDLCSLVPRSDRLTFTVEMRFDRKGNLLKKRFYPSVINSNERMTYTSVRKILTDNDRAERKKYGYLLESFELIKELYELLRQQSIRRGSLDFDLPEPEVLLDIQGRPEAIIKAERNVGHMIIEAFMIAANEAVASHIEDMGVPMIYRVHEKPDASKLEGLKKIFSSFGLQVKRTGPTAFHKIFRQAKGITEETLVNILLLRSLKQAKYSTENIGHFGLASKSYTHFTSPIRRYPDLVVHRILKDRIKGKGPSDKKRGLLENLLPEIAFHSSKTERAADEAEREIMDVMRAWFMKDKAGNEYEGVISAITPYGLKVQLKDFFVSGFLHVSNMPGDYYRFNEECYCLVGRNSKRTFSIGNNIRVVIERVSIEDREIAFAMA
ncbi:MAG TPA: ribonuclease R [Nitrospirae bacterium]|nr:ribonuclease R [Nitrospirota bacterium]HDO25257.1 ribonuclease R [Nitrospirota bacterium]HDZ84476.1 ribonuclease R [Nitrospirota bacterium]